MYVYTFGDGRGHTTISFAEPVTDEIAFIIGNANAGYMGTQMLCQFLAKRGVPAPVALSTDANVIRQEVSLDIGDYWPQ